MYNLLLGKVVPRVNNSSNIFVRNGIHIQKYYVTP